MLYLITITILLRWWWWFFGAAIRSSVAIRRWVALATIGSNTERSWIATAITSNAERIRIARWRYTNNFAISETTAKSTFLSSLSTKAAVITTVVKPAFLTSLFASGDATFGTDLVTITIRTACRYDTNTGIRPAAECRSGSVITTVIPTVVSGCTANNNPSRRSNTGNNPSGRSNAGNNPAGRSTADNDPAGSYRAGISIVAVKVIIKITRTAWTSWTWTAWTVVSTVVEASFLTSLFAATATGITVDVNNAASIT